jgi:hypothetical protein
MIRPEALRPIVADGLPVRGSTSVAIDDGDNPY